MNIVSLGSCHYTPLCECPPCSHRAWHSQLWWRCGAAGLPLWSAPAWRPCLDLGPALGPFWLCHWRVTSANSWAGLLFSTSVVSWKKCKEAFFYFFFNVSIQVSLLTLGKAALFNDFCPLSGGAGCLWAVLWFAFASDDPRTHRRISEEERDYIINSIGPQVKYFFSVRHFLTLELLFLIIKIKL